MANLKEVIRIGKVSSVDTGKKMARVVFEDKDNVVSAELPVLVNTPTIKAKDSQEGECTLDIKPWLPKVEQMVVVAYLPSGGGDGVILGGL